ncbi:hypothetical protein H1V43_33440 [Streptomyces sp. PSKA54]|uniref:Uncharacterized protein n=1 Tax=Streptomyces himalayensis subsp. aureolus TaxID=2758039 RepID=A0A7W2HJI9_9ACTN|nr:hypothetical protein [Streptomyces himalayensis]MBA4866143.1 hypothetical protein [Streptomyces himalayensis subsp. aureolus]
MGTKTAEAAGNKAGDEVDTVDEQTAGTEAEESTPEAADAEVETGADAEGGPAAEETAAKASTGVGQGAAAVVSAALGLVSLTGSWVGTVAQARDSLYGQLEVASGSSVATQIKQIYADSWNVNALVAGLFALAALIVGVVVLVRPAFGNPDRVQVPWIKSVAWAGVSLGFIGLLLAAAKYSDLILAMPST